MTDHPMLFSAPMIRALLAGNKTQTRRLAGVPEITLQDNGLWHIHNRFGGLVNVRADEVRTEAVDYMRIANGDRIYVRENWRTSQLYDDTKPRDLERGSFIHYEADGAEDQRTGVGRNGLHAYGKMRTCLHMPRWASRLTLDVIGVKVERLQDISDEDAQGEGIQLYGRFWGVDDTDWDDCETDPVAAYAALWRRINGAASWDANPWVAAYTFTVTQANVDD